MPDTGEKVSGMDYKGSHPPNKHLHPKPRRWTHFSALAMLSAVFALLALYVLRLAGAQTSVDTYIATESPIAKAKLLANIGPDGSESSGAKAGIGQNVVSVWAICDLILVLLALLARQSSRHRARSTRTTSTRGRATQVSSSKVSSALSTIDASL